MSFCAISTTLHIHLQWQNDIVNFRKFQNTIILVKMRDVLSFRLKQSSAVKKKKRKSVAIVANRLRIIAQQSRTNTLFLSLSQNS